MLSFAKGFWDFFKESKKYWLFPIIIILALFGAVALPDSALLLSFIRHFITILGISAFYHDSANTNHDGNIVSADKKKGLQEKRFSYPYNS